ncbi:MAG: hypothetical protein V7719_10300 [Psychroserpens sp.]|uniref:hypothetical protein n=1 Tax=Psychroserpens sp. TaxID=2020870 RepID=UPI003001B2A2
MKGLQLNMKSTLVSVMEFEHLKFEHQSDEHIVTLVDADGYEITRGYGSSITEAINDLHHNLI